MCQFGFWDILTLVLHLCKNEKSKYTAVCTLNSIFARIV